MLGDISSIMSTCISAVTRNAISYQIVRTGFSVHYLRWHIIYRKLITCTSCNPPFLCEVFSMVSGCKQNIWKAHYELPVNNPRSAYWDLYINTGCINKKWYIHKLNHNKFQTIILLLITRYSWGGDYFWIQCLLPHLVTYIQRYSPLKKTGENHASPLS